MVKRCFDMIASFCGLLVLSPLLAAVAMGIYFTDGPPVFFCQRRVGWRGRGFLLYKFRTMRVPKNSEAGSFDAGNALRVTRLGRLLRKTKIDELPQLWNVLRGDMSLVGPRPEVERWVAAFPERWAVIHTTRPGITDPASIVYRHEEELLSRAADAEAMYRQEILPRKLSLYETYVHTQTFWGDIHIILRTVAAVLTPHSATERT